MKRLLLAAVFACIASAASAQSATIYNRQGNFVARASTHASGTTTYSSGGQANTTCAGNLCTFVIRGHRSTYKVIQRGNTLHVLGKGPLAGKIVVNGNQRTYYDRNGRMIGTSLLRE